MSAIPTAVIASVITVTIPAAVVTVAIPTAIVPRIVPAIMPWRIPWVVPAIMPTAVIPRIVVPRIISGIDIDRQTVVVRFIEIYFIIFAVIINIDIVCTGNNNFGWIMEADDALC
jgi:hypothetical protein